MHNSICVYTNFFTSAHIVTCERTAAVSISNVVRLAAKRYEGSMGDYIVKLYERVKKGYNDYVHLIGGYITDVNKQQKKLEMITADTPLIRFLSGIYTLIIRLISQLLIRQL